MGGRRDGHEAIGTREVGPLHEDHPTEAQASSKAAVTRSGLRWTPYGAVGEGSRSASDTAPPGTVPC